METFQAHMAEYKKQLAKGTLQQAYKGLMEYILSLRAYCSRAYPEYVVAGLYTGYLDMTYFSFTPPYLKQRNLKIAIVFIHETCRFEAWLAATNKGVQAQYWKLFKDSGWQEYPLVPSTRGADAIAEHVLAADPDFSDLAALSQRIESGVLQFIQDIQSFLSAHDDKARHD